MTTSEYKAALEHLEHLAPDEQEQLLAELTARVRANQTHHPGRRPDPALIGKPGADLIQFAGSIDPSRLRAMEQAIEEECERIDPSGW